MWRSRAAASVAVVALLAVGCVRDNPPEPGVRSVTTDLEYKAIREAAAPPNTVPSAAVEEPPTFPPLPTRGIGPIAPPQPAVCPTAAPTEQADEDVPTTVTALPKEGEYLWQVDGSERFENIRLSFGRFHNRSVENVEGELGEEPDFTFETRERELSQTNTNPPFIVSTFQVNADGVFLTRIVRESSGGEMTEFNPVSPILFLPTPVIIGPDDGWESQGIDVVSEPQPQVLTHDAFVKGRITIDACGERLRAWEVVSKQTFASGGATIIRRYHYGIATHQGGVIIYEHVESPCDEDYPGKCDPEPDIIFDASLGKLRE